MRTLWNDGWKFSLLPLHSTYEEMLKAPQRDVILPHDWLIEDTSDLYRSGDGWYVKRFPFARKGQERVFVTFDGVYMDADILVQGEVVCTHRYGYTAFTVDMTDHLRDGENEIAVHIRHQSPNSRWYSGAGIFRDVFWDVLPACHMIPDGFQVQTIRQDDGTWLLDARAEMNLSGSRAPVMVLRDLSGNTVAEGVMAVSGTDASGCLTVASPALWSPDDPALYCLSFSLGEQTETIQVGFRQTAFTTDQGFFLNGKPIKLHGVCLHHDQGALGAAFHEKAAERQLRLMKAMGVNAIRTSHNPPARKFLDLCDKLGFLVDDEAFDMWEMPKTPYDNARFFPDTWKEDVASWVRRDRCHPSVVMWSIGNEIYDMHASQRGQMWTRSLMEEVRKHDSRHAVVTFGSNYMPWDGAQQCADIVKVPGYNYAEKYYETHHRAHPDWVIYGSETGSHLQSRGIYHFPMDANILSEEDLQCSALLNSMTSWGTQNLQKMLVDDALTSYSMGQFIWSGIDYIGEPTPYHTRNCYFGQADTACFPKDSYYFYQAMWTQLPMVHIGMIWDWNIGQEIDVPVMTNGASAELFLNGESLGRKEVDLRDAARCLPRWKVLYQPGVLRACAYDANGKLLCETARYSCKEAQRIVLTADRDAYTAGCRDMAFVEVSVLDAQGHPVENAGNRLHASVAGAGVLLGMDNGDSTDTDPYQTTDKNLFSGKLLLLIGVQDRAGTIRVSVSGQGLETAELCLTVNETETNPHQRFSSRCLASGETAFVPVRRIDMIPLGSTHLSPDKASVCFSVRLLPENACQQPVSYRVTNAAGVDVPSGIVTLEGNCVRVTALGDGRMYLRATVRNGADHARIISIQEVTAAGFGPVGLDPYRFLAGALSDVRRGEITPGNEQGIAFARDGRSVAGFSQVDFGPIGSDEITLPVFALDAQLYHIEVWDGIPGEGGRQIAVLPYQKPSIWNVYQAETYRLPEILTGIHLLCFAMERKVHLKGFSFTRQSGAYRYHPAVKADEVYGDSFEMDADAVRKIGNNVTLSFHNLEFESTGERTLQIDGFTPLETNAISVRITGPDGQAVTSMCRFAGSAEMSSQRFSVQVPQGMCTVSFIFLPGCQFDFTGFQFLKEA